MEKKNMLTYSQILRKQQELETLDDLLKLKIEEHEHEMVEELVRKRMKENLAFLRIFDCRH